MLIILNIFSIIIFISWEMNIKSKITRGLNKKTAVEYHQEYN